MTLQAMIDLFQKQVNAELARDLDTTMATMSDDPHLNHVPTMAGGVGRDGVRAFYRDHLVGKFFPPDVKMASVSRTVGESQIVEELAISFTHTTAIDWLLPGVAPTGKPVEMAVAVVVGAVIERTCMSMSASSMYRSLSSPRSRSGRVYCVQPVRLVPRRKKSDTRCTSAVLRHLKRLCITNKLNGNYPLHSRSRNSSER